MHSRCSIKDQDRSPPIIELMTDLKPATALCRALLHANSPVLEIPVFAPLNIGNTEVILTTQSSA
jgi:hypothetical protein